MLLLGKLHQPSFCIRISVYVLASMLTRKFWRSKLLRNPIMMHTHHHDGISEQLQEGLLSVPGRIISQIGSVHIRYTLMMHKYGSNMLTIRGDQPYLPAQRNCPVYNRQPPDRLMYCSPHTLKLLLVLDK